MKCPKCYSENPVIHKTSVAIAERSLRLQKGFLLLCTKTLETPTPGLAIGTLFAGRYEVLEELGRGGMGEVYRVKDQKLDEEMALKVVKPEIAAHKGTIERFKNELKLSRKIAHRHVCRMYDLNEEGEYPLHHHGVCSGGGSQEHHPQERKIRRNGIDHHCQTGVRRPGRGP